MGFEKAPLSRIAFLILQLNKRRVKSLNDSPCIISAESTTFPGSVIFKYVVKTKCHYESPNSGSPHYSGQQKLVLRHYIGMLFKPFKKSEGCCKLRRVVVESSSSFGKKICTCLLGTFYRPRVYGVSQSNYKSLFTQLIFLNMHLINILSVSSRVFHFFRRHDLHYLLYIFSR